MTEHDTLHDALAAVQADLPEIGKAHTAKVKTKSGSDFSYSYASLNDVNRALLPLLAEHGLTWACLPQSDGRMLGLLTHVSGDSLEASWPLTSTQDPQALGSAITYGRRYLLTAVVGSAPDEDDDGAAAKHARREPEPDPADVDAAEQALDEWAQQAPDFYAAEVEPKRQKLVEYASQGPGYLDTVVSRLVREQETWQGASGE